MQVWNIKHLVLIYYRWVICRRLLLRRTLTYQNVLIHQFDW